MKTTRIGVICNNRMAIPALRQLFLLRSLAGVAIPASNTELIDECRHALNGTGTIVSIFDREKLTEGIEAWMENIKADVVFMMTFPWKIPAEILNTYPNSFYNFHYGILPEMRGADPVFESIRSRKQEAGITVHLVTNGLDKGPVIFQQKIPLDEQITHGLLCAHLSALGAQVSQHLLPLFSEKEKIQMQPQHEADAKYYPRPGLKDVAINWENMDSASIHALVRACNPWNKGAYTSVKGWNIRICGLSYTDVLPETTVKPGTIIRANQEEGVIVTCKDGKGLRIDTIYTDEGIFEGKKLVQFGITQGDELINVI